ncbi:hypothetical protein, partial [Staphylococcus aureus]|uniref:hypothetical protein n=1 Tax=Staphylococcus aureus TaxID=1280 RepID=UPI0038B25349
TTTKKPDYSSLYIHNPIESGLNVSKNVANSELKNFIQAAKNALWQLEKSPEDNGKNEAWGIVKLFKKQKAVPSEELNR